MPQRRKSILPGSCETRATFERGQSIRVVRRQCGLGGFAAALQHGQIEHRGVEAARDAHAHRAGVVLQEQLRAR